MTYPSNLKKGALVWDRLTKQYGIKKFDSKNDLFIVNWLHGGNGDVRVADCLVVADRIISPPPPEELP